ncbi:hypothetical protein V8C40DRAFT_173615 [Trichoderma camerunense]
MGRIAVDTCTPCSFCISVRPSMHRGIMCPVCGRVSPVDHSKLAPTQRHARYASLMTRRRCAAWGEGTWPVGAVKWYVVVFGSLTQLDPFGSASYPKRDGNPQSKRTVGCTRSSVAFAGGQNPPSQLRRSAIPDLVQCFFFFLLVHFLNSPMSAFLCSWPQQRIFVIRPTASPAPHKWSVDESRPLRICVVYVTHWMHPHTWVL